MSGQLDKSAAAEHRDRGDLSTRADRQDKSGGLLGGLLGSGSPTRK